MASLIDYRGLQILSPNPSGDGGLAIQNNLKSLVDWSPKGVWGQTTNPVASDDDTSEYYPGSLWLRTNTTPCQLFVCKSSATAAAEWLPMLLTVSQDPAPKLSGDLDANGRRITDATTVALAVAGTTVALVTSSSLQVQGGFLLGTTTIPTGATFNAVFGGGSTSPVLGAPYADIVSIAAVDKAAGDRRLYVQSESGSAISIGNDRVNYAASNGIISIGGTDVLSVTTGGMTVSGKLGIGASPVTDVDLQTSNATYRIYASNSGGTATMQMRNPAQIWLMACQGSNSNRLAFSDGGGTVALNITTGYNLQLQGGATNPTLASAAADTISIVGVDKAAGDRRLYIQPELGSPISLGNDRLNFAGSAGIVSIGGTDILSVSTSAVTLTDAVNLTLGTSTGAKIGTSTSQKIGLWNATPVAQYNSTGTTTGFTTATGTGVLSGSTFTGNIGSTGYTMGDIVAALKKCGVIAS